MQPSELNCETGITALYVKLDSSFKKEENQFSLDINKKFEIYSRPANSTVAEYRVEFERLVRQLKRHKVNLHEPVLAYCFLKSAKLSNYHERLVRAKVNEITMESMMHQLNKIMYVKLEIYE